MSTIHRVGHFHMRLYVRAGGAILFLIVCAVALASTVGNTFPPTQTLLYLNKPTRYHSAELTMRDLRHGISHHLTTQANILSFAPSPDGSTVLYISDFNAAHSFFAFDMSTHNARFLMSDPSEAITPAWSPDGASIVYDNYTARTLYTADMATLATEIVLNYDGFLLAFPDWSPDGVHLVLASYNRQTDAQDILLYDLTDGTRRWLTRTPQTESHPRFSPDGSRLLYRVVNGARHTIVVHHLATGESEAVYDSLETVWAPDWSNDGSSIAFQVVDGEQSNLMLLDFRTGAVSPVTHGDGWNSNPIWLPAG